MKSPCCWHFYTQSVLLSFTFSSEDSEQITEKMARLLIYLLLGFCVYAFIDNAKAEEDDSGDDENEDDDDGVTVNVFGVTIAFNFDCVSGDMLLEEQTKGFVRVAELSKGDYIHGITGGERKPAWCKVEAVFPAAGGKHKITYDGFTKEHMVVKDGVHPYGERGEMTTGPIYTLATDCDANVNSVGQVFTPISTAFCPHELSWSEYITLMSAVRRGTNRTGYFWFDTSVDHDNDTAMVPHWYDQLHQICRELLLCSRLDECQEFENVMKEFVRNHVNSKYADIVERQFPNMGADVSKQQTGTITEVVRPQESSHIVLFSILGSAMVVLLIIAAAVVAYRVRMKKIKKELPFKPDANHSKVEA